MESYNGVQNSEVITTCSNCGTELTGEKKFCQSCGHSSGFVEQQEPISFQITKKKKNKAKVIVPLVVVVAIIIAIAAGVLLKKPTVEKIILSEDEIELKAGETYSLSYTIKPAEAEEAEVEWKSSDKEVAEVNRKGEITAIGDGFCTITVTADDESADVKITVKSGPDFKEIYDEYCNPIWATYGEDGSYLLIDTNPYDEDDTGIAYYEAYYAIQDVNEALGLPEYLFSDMGQTSASDGRQTEVFDDVTVTWKYHPDNGCEVTYKKNK